MTMASSQETPAQLPITYPPQFIIIPGLQNFRDIGGWSISPSKIPHSTTQPSSQNQNIPSTTTNPVSKNGNPKYQVRKGVFYRGPDTKPILLEGVVKLRELGVTTDFDLRSKGQIEKLGGPNEMEGITRVWAPAFPNREYTPEKAARRYVLYSSEGTEGIIEAFTEILAHSAPAFTQILNHLSTQPLTEASFIHCTTGNNRSGVYVSILLSFLGVSNEDIAKEYELSQIGLIETRDKAVERLMKSPVFANDPNGEEKCKRMVGARRESMLAFMRMVSEKWGGGEGFLRGECGMSDEVLDAVRRLLVEEIVEEKKGVNGKIKDDGLVKTNGNKEHGKGRRRKSSVWDVPREFLGRVFHRLG